VKKFVLVGLGLVLSSSFGWADGDAAKGEQTAKQCAACHSFTDTSNKVGPSLLGIVGRKPGTAEGYSYSEPFKTYAASVAAWDDATLDAWLKDPKSVVKGTKMTFAGLKVDAVRADLIAYLKTLH
jgi:cytochrome c